MYLETGCRGEYLDLRGRKWKGAGEDCIMRSFINCTCLSYQMKEDELGWECSEYGGDEKCLQNFDWKTVREETAWETSE
jgi:hypothetical protein